MSVIAVTSVAGPARARDLRRYWPGSSEAVWAGSPGGLRRCADWLQTEAPMLGGISWGLLWLSTDPALYRALRMLSAASTAVSGGLMERVVVIDADRCIRGGRTLEPESERFEGFSLSRGATPCINPNGLARNVRCPNSLTSASFWDWAVLGLTPTAESGIRELLRFGSDPRVCSDLPGLSAAIDRFVTVDPMENLGSLADVLGGAVNYSEAAVVTSPGLLRADGHYQTACGHPSAVGLWDLEGFVGKPLDPPRISDSACLPGGVQVDAPMRAAVVEGIRDYLDGSAAAPPDPWSDGPSAFLKWLESPSNSWRPGSSRYWDEVRAGRDDLAFAFPDPEGASAQDFREWCRNRFVTELSSPLLSAPFDPAELVEVPKEGDREPGVNVVGYLTKGFGLGVVARTITDHAQRSELPIAELPYWRSSSPTEVDVSPPYVLPYRCNLVVVTADQLRFLMAETPSALWSDHFNAAYWFWEAEEVPERFVSAASIFHEVWVATEFVRGALERALDIPVRRVPLPVRPLWENEFPLGTGDLDSESCRFLVTLDLNSVMARKNPGAAIDAYQRAFPVEVPGGPSLLVKTMNGHLHPADLHSLTRRAAHRSDIEVRDEVLSRSDQDALIASSSCLVSLHRSEGLGLHLAEAMALGVPVIATGYSGNLDFMNDSNSILINYELVDIDDAGPYTGCGKWAEPDVEAAARAMQELEGDWQRRRQLSKAARESIRSYSREAETELAAALQDLAARTVSKSAKG